MASDRMLLVSLLKSMAAIRKNVNSDISVSELSVYLYVALNDCCSISDIVKHSKINRISVVKAIRNLSRHSGASRKSDIDLLCKATDVNDSRKKSISLTANGNRLKEYIIETIANKKNQVEYISNNTAENVSCKITITKNKAKTSISKKEIFGNDEVVCLICGRAMKTLTRHIKASHKLKPGQYRKMFGIPRSQALSANSFSENSRKKAIERGQGAILVAARAAKVKGKTVVPSPIKIVSEDNGIEKLLKILSVS